MVPDPPGVKKLPMSCPSPSLCKTSQLSLQNSTAMRAQGKDCSVGRSECIVSSDASFRSRSAWLVSRGVNFCIQIRTIEANLSGLLHILKHKYYVNVH